MARPFLFVGPAGGHPAGKSLSSAASVTKTFPASASLRRWTKFAHDHVLTPGRYADAVDAEDDGDLFAVKMTRRTAQFAESNRLEAQIKQNLAGLRYALDG